MTEKRKIYAYITDDTINLAKNARENENCKNDFQKMLKTKVGETNLGREAEERIKEQSTASQSSNWRFLFQEGNTKSVWENVNHTDDEIRQCLIDHFGYFKCKETDIPNEEVLSRTKNEWVFIPLVDGETIEDTRKRAFNDIQRAINYLDHGVKRSKNYSPRSAQRRAYKKIVKHFEHTFGSQAAHFLLASKPRFGKNFTLLLAFEELGYKRVLVMSYFPFVFSSMRDDIQEHISFTKWQYINFKENRNLIEKLDNAEKTLVSCSAQLAEYRHNNNQDEEGEFTEAEERDYLVFMRKNIDILKKCNFDAVVVDEAHHGANTALFQSVMNELGIKNQIYVSGTAMRYNGDQRFNEDNTFSYDYVDECNDPEVTDMPKINIVTYEMNESVVSWAKEYYAEEEYFKFRKMWAVNSNGKFIHQAWVDSFLGVVLGRDGKNPRAIENSPYYMYNIEDSLWVMPYDVKAINAVANRIEELYGDEYYVINGAGSNGVKSSDEVKKQMRIAKNGFRKKTITLTCVRFLAGVSIADWNGVFMMDDSTSIVRYIQALYRAQTPKPGKKECYVVDFCPQRFLAVLHEYAYSRMYKNRHVSPSEIIREVLDCAPFFRHGENWNLVNKEPTLAEIFDANKLYFKGYDKYANKCSLSDKWDTEEIICLPRFNSSDSKDKNAKNGGVQVTDGGINGGKSFKPTDKGTGGNSFKKPIPEQEKERKNLIENCQEMLRRLPEYIYLTDSKELTMADVFANLDEEVFISTTKNDPGLFRWAWNNGYFNKKSLDHMVVRMNAEEAELERIKTEESFDEYRKHLDAFISSWFYRPDSSEIGMPSYLADHVAHALFHGNE